MESFTCSRDCCGSAGTVLTARPLANCSLSPLSALGDHQDTTRYCPQSRFYDLTNKIKSKEFPLSGVCLVSGLIVQVWRITPELDRTGDSGQAGQAGVDYLLKRVNWGNI